jgi:hypothetical protein
MQDLKLSSHVLRIISKIRLNIIWGKLLIIYDYDFGYVLVIYYIVSLVFDLLIFCFLFRHFSFRPFAFRSIVVSTFCNSTFLFSRPFLKFQPFAFRPFFLTSYSTIHAKVLLAPEGDRLVYDSPVIFFCPPVKTLLPC